MTDSAEASLTGNPAEVQNIIAALTSFGATMDTHGQALMKQQETLARHDEMLLQIGNALAQLTPLPSSPPHVHPSAPPGPASGSDPSSAPAPVPAPVPPATLPTTPHEPRLPAPPRYDGKHGECREFLTQCQLTFELQPATYTSDRSKIAYVVTLLADKARAWATSIWQRQGPECSDFKKFMEEMLRVFDQSDISQDAAKKLMSIRQGKGSVADYAISFRTLAAVSGWNDTALVSAFHHGLSDPIKDGLASIGCPTVLETLISHAIRLDNRIRERSRDPSFPYLTASSWSSPNSASDCPEPMQIGRTRLTAAERERRRRDKCCLYCGKPDHFRAACPELLGKGPSRPAEGGL